MHNEYEKAYLEIDADNVALALQYYIGDTASNKYLHRYFTVVHDSEARAQVSAPNQQISAIRAFIERRSSKVRDVRLSHLVDTTTFYQSTSNIELAFGESEETLTDMFRADIENIIHSNNIDESEFKLEDVKLYGSYATGQNRQGSDLDLLVQYSGSMREDDAFNMFNSDKIELTDIYRKHYIIAENLLVTLKNKLINFSKFFVGVLLNLLLKIFYKNLLLVAFC